MNSSKVEILAPAGSPESLRAAVNAGADAVYVGGLKFGARAYAENPDEETLLEGIGYAHLYGSRVHLTVNTLFKDPELLELPDYIKPYYEAGLDAAIVQDIGAFAVLKKHFPLLPLHASTQTTVTGPESAAFFKRLGAVRVIPARELSLSELRKIKEETGLEVETFVHGALCYSYSGQCLMSSLIGGRSGNRGRCAQTCRLPFTLLKDGKPVSAPGEPCLLSMKDLCALDLLPDIIEAGIDSLKIEGRMKSPRYTAGVVSVYRKYVDLYYAEGRSGYHVDRDDRKLLLELFDRGGQTEGYFRKHNGRDMVTLRKKPDFREGNEALNRRLDEAYVLNTPKIPVRGEAVIRAGEPMRLSVSLTRAGRKGGTVTIRAEAEGPVPEPAEKAGASAEEIRKRLEKTGGTSFVFDPLDVAADGGLFLPVSALNALRRDALHAMEEEIRDAARRAARLGGEDLDLPGTRDSADRKAQPGSEIQPDSEVRPGSNTRPECQGTDVRRRTPVLHVTCETAEQLAEAAVHPSVSEVSVLPDAISPERYRETAEDLHRRGKRFFLCLPQIFRKKAYDWLSGHQKEVREAGFDAFLIRSAEEAGALSACFSGAGASMPPLYTDFTLYAMNKEAVRILAKLPAERVTLPVELNRQELVRLSEGTGDLRLELVAAGRLPMMVSAQCLKKTAGNCDRREECLVLKDRNGAEMPVKNHCTFCTNVILNADPLWLGGEQDAVRRIRPDAVRVLLTTETGQESRRVLDAAAESFLSGRKCPDPYRKSTRGHMKRGVE